VGYHQNVVFIRHFSSLFVVHIIYVHSSISAVLRAVRMLLLATTINVNIEIHPKVLLEQVT